MKTLSATPIHLLLFRFLLIFLFTGGVLIAEEETLPPLKEGKAPQTFEEMWGTYDPRKEPLEGEVLKEWEEEGVILRVVRYRIGIFKGQKAMMAAIYGFPKGGTKLPGLVNIHGGGQFADYKAPLINAKRGYATITIAWAGRISAPDYKVTPEIVKLFWEGKTTDPLYKLTTDWGPLDAYHAPCRNPKNEFSHTNPAEWTLDSVDSPRNNPWFLCALGARRALTFLEQQPEVDPGKLGVYGHSMGGKLTVFTAASDSRVKACAPSCGGISNRYSRNPLFDATIGDQTLLRKIACPILFLSPSNDFHGRINNLQTALTEIQSKEFRMTCSPHHNHQDTSEYECATSLWFDQYFLKTFQYPETPSSRLELKTPNGIPTFTVTPDSSKPILSVDFYYTQQGPPEGTAQEENRDDAISRFWRHASGISSGKSWSAELPGITPEKPLWVYANVLYALDQPVTGAGYYYGIYSSKTFNLSSKMEIVTPEELKTAGIQSTEKPGLLIEKFEPGWEKEWFNYKAEEWAKSTYKLRDPQWKAPAGASLALEVQSKEKNKLIVRLDDFAAEISLNGGEAFQPILLSPGDFKNALGKPLSDWKSIRMLRLSDRENMVGKEEGKQKIVTLGSTWKGEVPAFKNLEWKIQP